MQNEIQRVIDETSFTMEVEGFIQPKTTPSIIDVPEMALVTVTGKGDPIRW